MNLTTSQSTPNKEEEKFNGIYKDYKWDNNTICENIRQNKLTPLNPPSDKKNSQNQTYCPLCYYYYPRINLTTCCNKSICTECFAAFINKPPNCTCPYCHKTGLNVTPNHDSKTAPDESPKEDEDDYLLNPNLMDGIPDDYVAIGYSFPGFDNLINALYKANFTPDQVINIIQSMKHASQDVVIDLAQQGMPASDILAILNEA